MELYILYVILKLIWRDEIQYMNPKIIPVVAVELSLFQIVLLFDLFSVRCVSYTLYLPIVCVSVQETFTGILEIYKVTYWLHTGIYW